MKNVVMPHSEEEEVDKVAEGATEAPSFGIAAEEVGAEAEEGVEKGGGATFHILPHLSAQGYCTTPPKCDFMKVHTCSTNQSLQRSAVLNIKQSQQPMSNKDYSPTTREE